MVASSAELNARFQMRISSSSPLRRRSEEIREQSVAEEIRGDPDGVGGDAVPPVTARACQRRPSMHSDDTARAAHRRGPCGRRGFLPLSCSRSRRGPTTDAATRARARRRHASAPSGAVLVARVAVDNARRGARASTRCRGESARGGPRTSTARGRCHSRRQTSGPQRFCSAPARGRRLR